MKFNAKAHNGQLSFYNSDFVKSWLSEKECKELIVSIATDTNTRSAKQNRWYHAMKQCIWHGLRDVGFDYSIDQVHEMLKIMYLPRTKFILKDTEYTVPRSTKDLTTVEFNQFCENVYALGVQDIGIYMPHPELYGITD